MNENIRERILRKLDTLSDERGYQVLDYGEFLESRYAERQTAASAFTRFTEAVEDKLRAGKVSASAIAETVGLMNRAANVLSGAVAATQKMATEFVNAPGRQNTTAADTAPPPQSTTTSSTNTGAATSSSSAGATVGSASTAPTEAPGASGEKL